MRQQTVAGIGPAERVEAGNLCKAYREKHDLTQLQMAVKLLTDPKIISNIERGADGRPSRVIRDILYLCGSPLRAGLEPPQSLAGKTFI